MSTTDYATLEAQHAADRAAFEASGARLEWWPDSPRTSAVLGWYTATEPTGAASDHVHVTGFAVQTTNEVDRLALVVSCAEFGAIPEGWASAVETFDPDAFLTAYRRMTDAERSALAEQQAAESEAVSEADGDAITRAARAQIAIAERVAQLKKKGTR